ncbi:hypothetical protein [Asticcacaulis taihuensis]|jgi:hypothetical protein|uniref:hypothetical protein n=1 Tax=Asticcacaulis taihuensis TaxID=260084 RepID=UPI0026EC3406|nr:hypothetical protein [Asticcacaulis taihuensis]
MPSQIGKLKYVFIILLGLCSAGIVGYGWLYDIPKKKCESAQGWYSWKAHKCYAPIALSTITGRPNGNKDGEKATIDYHDDALKASNARAVNGAVNSAASK